jgi:hypothetical protein
MTDDGTGDPVGFRLAGFGGAAVTLRVAFVPARTFATNFPTRAFDIGFVSPEVRTEYRARPAGQDFLERLAAFCFRAASDLHPEQSLDTLQEDLMGLTVAVVASTDERVELEFSLVEDPGAEVREYDGIGFETSRAAMVTASGDLERLDRPADGPWGG